MGVLITSDPHFGHRKVAEIRGFGENVHEHDDAVLDSLFSSVRNGDDLWILGDLSANASGEAHALGLLGGMKKAMPNLRLHLVAGNHDTVSPIHRDSWKHQRRFMEVFDSVQAFARRRGPNRVPVHLSHFPFAAAGDGPGREGARHLEFRLPDVGQWLLHGHTHQSEKISGPRSIHVGWDAWRRPVKWDEILDTIEQEEK